MCWSSVNLQIVFHHKVSVCYHKEELFGLDYQKVFLFLVVLVNNPKENDRLPAFSSTAFDLSLNYLL